MKIGITGSSGVLGSEFLKILNKKNTNNFQGRVEKNQDVQKWICKNNFDAIFHFAAIVSTSKVNSNKKKALLINYTGTKNIIDAVNKFSKKKVFFFTHQHLMFIIFPYINVKKLIKQFQFLITVKQNYYVKIIYYLINLKLYLV